MRNFKKILLILILLFLNNIIVNAEVINIPPIVIQSKEENSLDNPINILSNLKKAVAKNKKFHQLSKEEEAKEILKILRKSMPIQNKLLSHKKSIKKKLHLIKRKTKIAKKNIKKKIHSSKIKVVKTDIKKDKIVTLKTKQVYQKQEFSFNHTISQSPEPIGFVKTLGIVGKSEVYEIDDLTIDKPKELTNEGVVDISSIATTNSEDLENLPFVKPIEVIEVTKPFEASEAQKYLY